MSANPGQSAAGRSAKQTQAAASGPKTKNAGFPAESEQLKRLRSKYGVKLDTLSDMFPSWSDEDLLFALNDAAGDVELTAFRIADGVTTQWGAVKSKKSNRKAEPATEQTLAEGSTNSSFPTSADRHGKQPHSRLPSSAKAAHSHGQQSTGRVPDRSKAQRGTAKPQRQQSRPAVKDRSRPSISTQTSKPEDPEEAAPVQSVAPPVQQKPKAKSWAQIAKPPSPKPLPKPTPVVTSAPPALKPTVTEASVWETPLADAPREWPEETETAGVLPEAEERDSEPSRELEVATQIDDIEPEILADKTEPVTAEEPKTHTPLPASIGSAAPPHRSQSEAVVLPQNGLLDLDRLDLQFGTLAMNGTVVKEDPSPAEKVAPTVQPLSQDSRVRFAENSQLASQQTASLPPAPQAQPATSLPPSQPAATLPLQQPAGQTHPSYYNPPPGYAQQTRYAPQPAQQQQFSTPVRQDLRQHGVHQMIGGNLHHSQQPTENDYSLQNTDQQRAGMFYESYQQPGQSANIYGQNTGAYGNAVGRSDDAQAGQQITSSMQHLAGNGQQTAANYGMVPQFFTYPYYSQTFSSQQPFQPSHAFQQQYAVSQPYVSYNTPQPPYSNNGRAAQVPYGQQTSQSNPVAGSGLGSFRQSANLMQQNTIAGQQTSTGTSVATSTGATHYQQQSHASYGGAVHYQPQQLHLPHHMQQPHQQQHNYFDQRLMMPQPLVAGAGQHIVPGQIQTPNVDGLKDFQTGRKEMDGSNYF